MSRIGNAFLCALGLAGVYCTAVHVDDIDYNLNRFHNRPLLHKTTGVEVLDLTHSSPPYAPSRDTVITQNQSGLLSLFGARDKQTIKYESDAAYTERTGWLRCSARNGYSSVITWNTGLDVKKSVTYDCVKNSVKRMMNNCEDAPVDMDKGIIYSVYPGLSYDGYADTLKFDKNIKPMLKEYALKAYKEIKHIK